VFTFPGGERVAISPVSSYRGAYGDASWLGLLEALVRP
jgi:hypothetical protein